MLKPNFYTTTVLYYTCHTGMTWSTTSVISDLRLKKLVISDLVLQMLVINDLVLQMLVKECSLKELQARSLVDDFDLNRDGTIDKKEFMTMWIKLFG